MLIAILKNPYKTEEPIPIEFFNEKTRPFLKEANPTKHFGIDALICSYINHKYNKQGIFCKLVHVNDILNCDFDLLWSGSEYWAPNYAELTYWNKYVQLLSKLPPKKRKLTNLKQL